MNPARFSSATARMRGASFWSVLFLSALAFSVVVADKRIDIMAPSDLAQQFPNEIPLRPALFGPNLFGRSILGAVYSNQDPSNPQSCLAINGSNTLPPFPTSQQGFPLILMVDRGGCNFVKKVSNAQDLGASAVIVVASQADGNNLPYMADDGTGSRIGIPAVIIPYAAAATIRSYLSGSQAVLIQMTWSPDAVVEVDLWTSSNDSSTAQFKANFGPVVAAFGSSMTFTPRYQILPGQYLGCPGNSYCSKLCLGSGKYCARDPEGDPTTGFDGIDVVRENLYGSCVANLSTAMQKPQLWFSYVTQFASKCKINDATCRISVLTSLGLDTSAVQNCYSISWSTPGDETSTNPPMAQFIADQTTFGVFTLPFLTINLIPFRTTISCASYALGSCTLIDTICSGYKPGTQPALCVPASSSTDTSGGSGGGGGGMSGGTVAAIVIPIVLVAVIGVIWFVRRQRTALRGEIDSIIQQYLPLSEDHHEQDSSKPLQDMSGRSGRLMESDAGHTDA